MRNDKTIPIVVGVTGHRRLREEDLPALRAAVREQLIALQKRCPHSEVLMLNSLAAGADQLCADVAAELGMGLIAALPTEREEYEKSFTDSERACFARYCAAAARVFTVPPTETPPPQPDRDFSFRQAGIYISAHSHVLIALWDGKPGKEKGCGTAEAVAFSLEGAYDPAQGVALRSASNEAVIHLYAPRGEDGDKRVGQVEILGGREAMEEMLARTDEFNRLAAALPDMILPPGRKDDGALRRMERLYRAADTLSVRFAALYRRVLIALAAAGSLLAMAFLLYDEAQATWMILVCGAALLGAALTLRCAGKSACHRRYIEYRALAECLRVQVFLRYAGSAVETQELLSWSQQEETAWIMEALGALALGLPEGEKHDIRKCWVLRQLEYHREAGKKAARSVHLSDRVVRTALCVSILLYVAAVGFELLCGGLIFPPRFAVGDVESYRTLLKIALGTLSATTLFIAGYYGKQSLPRSLSDHEKMQRFYEKIDAQLSRRGQTEELLAVLAREELIENGNWCSYQRDNTPDISF